MLTNTADGIVDWLKNNQGGLTFHFRNVGTANGANLCINDWNIYVSDEANHYLYEIAEIYDNKLIIYNRQATFDGNVSTFADCKDDELFLKKTVGAVRENDLEKFIKFYYNKMKWAKKLYKEDLIKNICKETIDD